MNLIQQNFQLMVRNMRRVNGLEIDYLTVLVFFVVSFMETQSQDRFFTLSRQSFALNLFKNFSSVESFLISPVSIDLALSVIFFGSSQQTFLELMKGLNYPKNYSMNLIQSNFQLLVRNMRRVNGLEIATKLYINESLQAQPNFRSIITRVLNAEIEPIAFINTEVAASTMNAWVAKKTHNMIKKVIDPNSLQGSIYMVLINCIYFKGSWLYTFPKDKSFTGDFYTDNVNKVQADFMTIKENFLFGSIEELGGAKAVILPYKNSDMSMLLVQPRERDGIQSLIKNISNFDWTKIESTMWKTKVNVTMPKFNITFESKIDNVLRNMGMTLMFDAKNASLDRMLTLNMQDLNTNIDTVIHKAVITVDEEGTEAAAVTVIITRSMDFDFTANYPFIFMLRNKANIFFIGTYLGGNVKSSDFVYVATPNMHNFKFIK